MKRKIVCAGIMLLCLGIFAACGKEEKETGEQIQEEVVKEAEDATDTPRENEEGTAEEVTPEETMPQAFKKRGVIVALDPGHQSSDIDMSEMEENAPGSGEMKAKATSGTSGQYTGIPESQLNLDIALAVRDRLVAQGYDVVMTREDNETAISNAERATLANEAGADISVRIHANGSEDKSQSGALALISTEENPYVGSLYDDSYRLAEQVLNAYCASTGMENLGIQKTDTMTGINWSKIPVMILEMGFMSNEQDDRNMADADYRTKMVEGIVNGINAYYGY